MDTKVHNKMLMNRSQQYVKRVIHGDQGGFIAGVQGRFSISAFISGTHHISGWKKKNHTIISISTERVCDKIQHAFRKTGIQGNFLNVLVSTHRAGQSGMRCHCSSSAAEGRRRKYRSWSSARRNQQSVHRWHNYSIIKFPKALQKYCWNYTRAGSKAAGYKINTQVDCVSICSSGHVDAKSKNAILFTLLEKMQHWDTANKSCVGLCAAPAGAYVGTQDLSEGETHCVHMSVACLFLPHWFTAFLAKSQKGFLWTWTRWS